MHDTGITLHTYIIIYVVYTTTCAVHGYLIIMSVMYLIEELIAYSDYELIINQLI